MIFQFILPYLFKLAAAVALGVVAYMILPRPHAPKPELRDLEAPTADAGRPMPILFGTKPVKGVNIIWFGEKTTNQYKVKA